MDKLDRLAMEMISYYTGEPKQIQHFIKVHAFSALIGKSEGVAPDVQEILEAAAYVHDIGIKPSMIKYGNCLGPNQEREGIAPAHEMLQDIGFSKDVVERVAYLVGHHHTYEGIDGIDWQIVLEADYLVNSYEGAADIASIQKAYDSFFRTDTGRMLLRLQFPDIA